MNAQNSFTSNDSVNIFCKDYDELSCTYYINDDTLLFNITAVKDVRNYISDSYSKCVDETDVGTLMVSFDSNIWFSSFKTD